MKNGLSGFTRRKESPYDSVDAGHSSTSVSQAIGFAFADKFKGKNNRHTLVVIGDGALTGGASFEGFNFIGHEDLPLIIILNDNEMSIGENVGSVSRHFAELTLTRPYQRLTDIYTNVMKKRKGIIKFLFWFAKGVERVLKLILGYENIFLNLGFEYVGPVDGHDIEKLINIFEKIKINVNRPILIHVKTTKGKGYGQAEDNPQDFHGVTPYLMREGKIEMKEVKTFTEIFSDLIVELAEKNDSIIAITAAMEEGTGLKQFKTKFPERFIDVGIAEQHAVSMASTLGYSGLKPVFAVYSTFLQRAVDQIIQDVCIGRSPVVFAIDRAGIAGSDGETHQGQFDIAYLRMIPGITIFAPCDASELKLMLEYAVNAASPVAVRYPRDFAADSQLDGNHPDILKNPFVILEEGREVMIIVIGPFISLAKECCEKLKLKNISCGALYLRMLKPIDDTLLYSKISKYSKIVVIEESVFSGSVSEYIGSLISKNGSKIKFGSINIPDEFIEHDTRQNILQKIGFNSENILNVILG